jgi:hypothetical protein
MFKTHFGALSKTKSSKIQNTPKIAATRLVKKKSNRYHVMREMSSARPKMLTKDEAELYDRQIRLWGVDAQNR